MTLPRHPKGHPKAGQFLTREEVSKFQYQTGRDSPLIASYKPDQLNPTQIEEVLAKIAPPVSLSAAVEANNAKNIAAMFAYYRKEGAQVSYGENLSPKQASSKSHWSWTRAALDVLCASFITSCLCMYGAAIYLGARYELPKLIALLSP